MLNKKNIFILLLALGVLGGIFVFKNKNKDDGSLAYLLNKNRVTLEGIIDFSITQRFENNFSAENDGEIIKVKIFNDFNAKEAGEYIASQTVLLNGLFEPQLPPYPEFLTKQTGCDDKYKPIKENGEYGDSYLMYAGSRFGYGVCVDDLIEYKASLGFYYCPESKTLFKLEYFTGKNEDFGKLQTLNKSFNCL
ncbi:MAG: hypothetical protein COU71_00700 [Parcubacteria group bacterium CG10_big_fil_rev_8_21_14_0_10_38_31]|nr:MAG: hypothetical protein COU71_00700 [Parcubacteria group bacterium CG10_big_fil_rev_8_21_14_0_10_38_31]